MTNKIPQEIEEKILKDVFDDLWDENWNQNKEEAIMMIKQAIQLSYEAGQKQSEDAFKEMIEEAKSKVPKGSQTEAVLDVLEQELNSKEKKQDE